MVKIELVKPSYEMETMIFELVSEFKVHKEDIINGCCGLMRCNDYCEWMEYIRQVENGLIDRTPSSTFVAIDTISKSIVGIIDIRHYLNEKHYYSGHIGYSIRPNLRCKGYGTEIIQLGIEKAKDINIENLLISCKKSNIASQKVIERNKGILEKEIFDDGEVYLVYWIRV